MNSKKIQYTYDVMLSVTLFAVSDGDGDTVIALQPKFELLPMNSKKNDNILTILCFQNRYLQFLNRLADMRVLEFCI